MDKHIRDKFSKNGAASEQSRSEELQLIMRKLADLERRMQEAQEREDMPSLATTSSGLPSVTRRLEVVKTDSDSDEPPCPINPFMLQSSVTRMGSTLPPRLSSSYLPYSQPQTAAAQLAAMRAVQEERRRIEEEEMVRLVLEVEREERKHKEDEANRKRQERVLIKQMRKKQEEEWRKAGMEVGLSTASSSLSKTFKRKREGSEPESDYENEGAGKEEQMVVRAKRRGEVKLEAAPTQIRFKEIMGGDNPCAKCTARGIRCEVSGGSAWRCRLCKERNWKCLPNKMNSQKLPLAFSSQKDVARLTTVLDHTDATMRELAKVVNKLSAALAGLGRTGSLAVRRKKSVVYVGSDDGEDEKSGQEAM